VADGGQLYVLHPVESVLLKAKLQALHKVRFFGQQVLSRGGWWCTL